MSSDGWQRAWSTPPASPRPEPTWEPDDAALRRRSRQDSIGQLSVAGALWALQALVPGNSGLGFAMGWSLVTLVNLARINVPGWRGSHRRRIRRQLREDHALRAHVSIGVDARERVSRTARWRRWGIPVLYVAGPLAAGLLAWAATAVDRPAALLPLLAVVIVGYCYGLVVWPRRLRDARRWLADPLPREDR